MSSRKERKEKFLATMAEPEALDNICDRISDGGTLSDISRELNANYRWLYSWFNDPEFPERSKMFNEAEAARDSLSKEDVVGQLGRLSNLDVRQAYDNNGTLKPIHEMSKEVAMAISSIDVTENATGDVTKKVRFVDRGQMIALSGRRNRMFVDKLEVAGQMTLEQAVMESVKPRNE